LIIAVLIKVRLAAYRSEYDVFYIKVCFDKKQYKPPYKGQKFFFKEFSNILETKLEEGFGLSYKNLLLFLIPDYGKKFPFGYHNNLIPDLCTTGFC
jgi:hypothetical protein